MLRGKHNGRWLIGHSSKKFMTVLSEIDYYYLHDRSHDTNRAFLLQFSDLHILTFDTESQRLHSSMLKSMLRRQQQQYEMTRSAILQGQSAVISGQSVTSTPCGRQPRKHNPSNEPQYSYLIRTICHQSLRALALTSPQVANYR